MSDITLAQQAILRDRLGTVDLNDTPQMWAMYKEVMWYFANGVSDTYWCCIPLTFSWKCLRTVRALPMGRITLMAVTPLLADDNWGNLIAVMPDEKHPGGGGIYYHVDCKSCREKDGG